MWSYVREKSKESESVEASVGNVENVEAKGSKQANEVKDFGILSCKGSWIEEWSSEDLELL